MLLQKYGFGKSVVPKAAKLVKKVCFRCWVLMPNRLEKTYDRVLIALKELGYKLDPKGFEPINISLDFEVSESNSFQRHFPGFHCDNCHHHLFTIRPYFWGLSTGDLALGT